MYPLIKALGSTPPDGKSNNHGRKTMLISDLLKTERAKTGKTVAEIAAATGLEEKYLEAMEAGKSKSVGVTRAQLILLMDGYELNIIDTLNALNNELFTGRRTAPRAGRPESE